MYVLPVIHGVMFLHDFVFQPQDAFEGCSVQFAFLQFVFIANCHCREVCYSPATKPHKWGNLLLLIYFFRLKRWQATCSCEKKSVFLKNEDDLWIIDKFILLFGDVRSSLKSTFDLYNNKMNCKMISNRIPWNTNLSTTNKLKTSVR